VLQIKDKEEEEEEEEEGGNMDDIRDTQHDII
jgi:hypothetical protein